MSASILGRTGGVGQRERVLQKSVKVRRGICRPTPYHRVHPLLGSTCNVLVCMEVSDEKLSLQFHDYYLFGVNSIIPRSWASARSVWRRHGRSLVDVPPIQITGTVTQTRNRRHPPSVSPYRRDPPLWGELATQPNRVAGAGTCPLA